VIRDFPTPPVEAWQTYARGWLADPFEPVPTRGAATVLLVRDGASGPEVFLQRRAPTMEFAPSMFVFPGGGVDPQDVEARLPDEALGRLAASMGCPPEDARPFVAAAVRELDEECGVRLDPADLVVRAHWITPPFERRRYDTWFFAAALPEGAQARGLTSEADHVRWSTPAEMFAMAAGGRALMLPPTVVALEQLGAFSSIADFLADQPAIVPIEPVLTDLGDRLVMRAELP
jgi:8-oxo-dGTP pyrophosphatase MutT (NUDIX family)